MGTAILVFCLACAVDFLWASYIRHTAAGSAMKSAVYAMAIVVAGSLTTLFYVRDPRLIIPAALGAFLGTYLCVRRKP
jgi:hypothetical protein